MAANFNFRNNNSNFFKDAPKARGVSFSDVSNGDRLGSASEAVGSLPAVMNMMAKHHPSPTLTRGPQ